MNEIRTMEPRVIAATIGTHLWAYLEVELQKGNALLLPMRLFIGLGWTRAGVEKLLDPMWRAGESLPAFFNAQIHADAVYFPFYETLMTQLFTPHAVGLSWLIMVGEVLAGIAILAGILTNLALLAGLFMNLNFILAGVVSPSAFYMVIQGTLLGANVGTTLGGDTLLVRYIRPLLPEGMLADESTSKVGKWLILLSGIFCTVIAALIVPYIRNFGPHSIEDPAMLLFIVFMLGAMLAGIQFIRHTMPGVRTIMTRSLARPVTAGTEQ